MFTNWLSALRQKNTPSSTSSVGVPQTRSQLKKLECTVRYRNQRTARRSIQLSSPSGEADSMTGLMDAVIIPSPDGISAPTPFFFGFSESIVSSQARNSRARPHSE